MIHLIRASAIQIPLADESVQCVVTSPPYWGLRKYDGDQEFIWSGVKECGHEWVAERVDKMRWGSAEGASEKQKSNTGTIAPMDGIQKGNTCVWCGAWRGSYGLEPSVQMYVQHTIEIMREIGRVLKFDGVVFWNIGDSYAGGGNYRGMNSENTLTAKQASNGGARGVHQELGALGKDTGSAKPKDLCLIPQRVAIAAQEDGWWVRSDIIWSKPNPMPESCKDRPTDAYEHILMLTKSAKYYWDKEAVQEPAQDWGTRDRENFRSGTLDPLLKHYGLKNANNAATGRNMRNIWTFPTQPPAKEYRGVHFATFPEELPRKCILAGSKVGDIVFDPFAGSGTTGQVARSLGRRAVLMDIAYQSGAYLELAKSKVYSQTKEEKKVAKVKDEIGF